ncbi:MAG: DUF6151 family protein [Gammaproteobacteria bacterium]|nr:DUF6151 family protein [Gammaproteobacteria bacterium]
MTTEIPLKCECGAVTGAAKLEPAGRRIVCMCQSCQAFAHFLGRAETMLDAHGGTDVYQLTPAQVRISQGEDNLHCVRLSDKGILRWYTSCCKTPIGNTLPSASIPFVGMPTIFVDHTDEQSLDELLGPVRHRVYARYAISEPENAHQSGPISLIMGTMVNMLVNSVRGLGKPTPFFEPDSGNPVAVPEVLSADDRTALGLPANP